MSHTDPIADMLTRIKNAILAEKKELNMPLSKVKIEIAQKLKKEGFIKNFNVDKENFPPKLTIELKYYEKNKSAIEGIERISKPGRRVYSGVEEIPKVLNGLGVSILSTSKGLLTGKECERNNVGGEVMLYVW